MTTQQLETFIQVAENLNFARAAEILNITTSAVSRQIRALEDEFDTTLLHRSTRTVTLTPAGIIFLNDAKEILAKLQLTSQKIKNHSEENIQIISIGCISDVDLSLMTQLLHSVRKRAPEIHPFLRIIPSRLVINMLIHDEIDILFAFKDDVPMRDSFSYFELEQIPVCAVLPSDHPLCQRNELSEKDLSSEAIVLCNSYEIPSQIAGIQNRLSQKASPGATYYSENLQVSLSLIKAGYGTGVLPQVPSTDTALTFIPFAGQAPLSYGIFYRKNARPHLKPVLSILKEIKQ